MAWKERSRVDERVLLVAEYVKGEQSMAALCREFGISRKTAYKWLARYTAEGPSGLDDRSVRRCRIRTVWTRSSWKRF
jgi:putative transposase